MSNDAERETPSEAEARRYLEMFLPPDPRMFSHRESRKAVAEYRAAVLREAAAARREDDAATRRLVERLRDQLSTWSRSAFAEAVVRDADAWLAAHKEDE